MPIATVTATNSRGPAQLSFEINIDPRTQATAAGAIAAQTWTVDDTTVSVNAATDFTANGNTLTYSATGLPAGVTINSAGTISGTPTAASSGSIVITATDEYLRETTSTTSHTTALRAQATGGVDLDLSFAAESAITPTNLLANWTTNGNTLTYAIVGTPLPTGLSVSTAGSMTGTPTTVNADATYTLRGTDEYGRTTDDTFTLEITAVPSGSFSSAFSSAFDVAEASAFSPLSLFASGEQGAWYDPSDLSTLWKDTAGTDPVTTAGDTVARVDDKSGNGNNLTQDSAAARPVYQTSGGLHWLDFDDVDDRMSAALPVGLKAGWSTVMGVNRKTTNGAQLLLGLNANSSTTDYFRISGLTLQRLWCLTRKDAETEVRTPATSNELEVSTDYVLTFVVRDDTTTNFHQINQDTLRTIASDWPAATVRGTETALSLPSAASVEIITHGLLTINRELTSTELDDLQVWMAAKAGVTL